ncbi:DUF3179 domain-containing protein [Spirulina sp. CS-785/01]|uniref:DUF3179 domain-containing protein n=1 Tax=Spirulina sp. CS-785/01 TaxID=3021716 RepID=UPI0023306A70|nr:DUF3179 domain-containing protein [Spirulina sp. CS-785/01]MDB9314337.1 DUF3179 domain-containing protein [Spirulina sp. CS-785/01]
MKPLNRMNRLILGTGGAVALLLGTFVLQADGWENFKLQYFHLTSFLNDQTQELDDVRKQNINPQTNTRINLEQLLNGGPPKDGIPSIDNPQFDTPSTTPFHENDIAIGVVINGEAKAYPFGIMNWHEIVNDTVGGKNVTISYCPLCDTIVAFERGNTTFGVSGKLYQSCLVMYDRADDSLYSQPWALGVVGKQVNDTLNRIPAVKTTLGEWLDKHPDSQILSTDTGHQRDYFNYPYGDYYTNDQIIFPVRNQDQRNLHPKAIVSYIWEHNGETPFNEFSGSHHAFSHQKLQQTGEQVVEFNGRKVKAIWDDSLDTVRVEEMDGTVIPSSTAFAFVYPAFFRD